MNDYIIRAIAANDQIRAFAAVTTETVETARQDHNTSPVATAALGRLLTAGAMMGTMMKGDKDILTLQIKAGGPLEGITVTADSKGRVKGYVGNPDVCIPANSKGKLDVAGAVGVGFMNVIKDMGLKEPYVGQVALQTSEIAEDLTYYFATSEQVPSAVGLGVLMNKDNTVRQAAEILDITQYLDRKPKALSGGQRQRVAIGRAIVRDPAVFLMDEPLSNLDAKLRNQMRAELIKLRERIDTTFIYVTHDQTEAMTLGDRIVIMKDGFIQQIGTPQEVFDHPANLFVAGFIGTPQMNLFDAHLARKDGKYTVTVGSVTVELSEEKQQRLAAKDVAEQDVVLGVRPDHIMLCADGVKGKVDVSEMMGSSVHLHVTAEGKDVIVIVPTNGAAAHFPAGSEVNMIFGGNVAHVFSKETEKNLEW